MPFAVADRKTEPSSDSARRRRPPPTSRRPAPATSDGHQSPVSPVMTTAPSEAGGHVGRAHAPRRPRSARAGTGVRPSGRTMSGCSSPRSASPRAAPSVRKTASTTPRNSVPNIASPRIVAPASVGGVDPRPRCRRSRRRPRTARCSPTSTARRRPRVRRDDDGEDPPAQALAQRVAGDDERDARSCAVADRLPGRRPRGSSARPARRRSRSPSATSRATSRRHVVARGGREAPHAAGRLDLDALRAAQLVGRPRGDEPARVDDRHAVAHALDLAEQVGVEQHGHAAARAAPPAARAPCGARRGPARSWARRAAAAAGSPTSAWAIPRRCCMPLDIVSMRRSRAVGRPTSSSSSARSAGTAGRARQRWCSSSSSSAVAQPGKRNSSAR